MGITINLTKLLIVGNAIVKSELPTAWAVGTTGRAGAVMAGLQVLSRNMIGKIIGIVTPAVVAKIARQAVGNVNILSMQKGRFRIDAL